MTKMSKKILAGLATAIIVTSVVKATETTISDSKVAEAFSSNQPAYSQSQVFEQTGGTSSVYYAQNYFQQEDEVQTKGKVGSILDDIKDNANDTAGTTDEIDWSKEPPQQWIDNIVLKTQNILLNCDALKGLISHFDTEAEVKEILVRSLAEKNGEAYTGSAEYSMRMLSEIANNEEFTNEANFCVNRYELFTNAQGEVAENEKGDSITSNPEKDGNSSSSTSKASAYDEKRIDFWAIVASLGVAVLAAATIATIMAKRTLTRGRTIRIAGTRYNLGKTSTYDARKLSRINKKIEKRNKKAKKLEIKLAKTNKNKEATRKSLTNRIKRLSETSLSTKSLYKTKERLERKCYYDCFNSNHNPKFLKSYAERAIAGVRLLGGRNKEYFSQNNPHAPTSKDYLTLMKGLRYYAMAEIAKNNDHANRSNKYLSKAKELLKQAKIQDLENIYYGSQNTLQLPDLDKPIPVFPERFFSAPSLSADDAKEMQEYFDEVLRINPNLERNANYEVISFKVGDREESFCYGMDNLEGANLIREKLITLIPNEATEVKFSKIVQAPRKIYTPQVITYNMETENGKIKFANRQLIAANKSVDFANKIAEIQEEQGITFSFEQQETQQVEEVAYQPQQPTIQQTVENEQEQNNQQQNNKKEHNRQEEQGM